MVAQATALAVAETGQAMQRLGLRAAGNLVYKQDEFRWIGVQKPLVQNGGEVDASATIIGDVNTAGYTDIGENVVIRGETSMVSSGPGVEYGKNSVILAGYKSSTGLPPKTLIGEYAKIGENCVLESCIIGNYARIGDGSIISEGSIVGFDSELQPGTVVPPNHLIPERQVWGGNPAKFVADVSDH
eukprot:CAMPEP_0184527254 /NCGR_PEP_ID=MMETSP0198_2-20121128/11096_1 /TAXON_ID=1112570 /ORGANISM="Thraustochytrium sp., Strain LLF1b" /LENGTH=185 /DNA_ID=CAMNT_0026918893 /DNA_START=181 /DNA_END=738 /DNA_ORIENTATION=-